MPDQPTPQQIHDRYRMAEKNRWLVNPGQRVRVADAPGGQTYRMVGPHPKYPERAVLYVEKATVGSVFVDLHFADLTVDEGP